MKKNEKEEICHFTECFISGDKRTKPAICPWVIKCKDGTSDCGYG